MKSLIWGSGMLFLLLAGCKAPPAVTKVHPVCAGGEMMMQTTLWFGLSRAQGPAVTGLDWQHFVDTEVTPRFNQGLSVYDAKGQWLEGGGTLARENSKALMLIHHPDEVSYAHIEALRDIYKKRFSQESVMRVDTPACVSF